MKKYLLLLLLLAAGWGYYTGSSETAAVRPQGHAAGQTGAAPTNGDSLLSHAADAAASTARDFFTGVSRLAGGSAPEESPDPVSALPSPAEGAAPALPLSAENPQLRALPEEQSIFGQFRDAYEFQQTLESRLARDRFVPSSQIPKQMKEAIIATEDRRFYHHGAIDLQGVIRAMFANYSAGQTVEGGSTISQQAVKNIFLSNERTMARKAREFFLALQLERNYTKDQILEIYLNTIYFGHGAYGIGDAARTYFGKEPEDLTLIQCAMLAGLPQAPSAYDPIDHPEEAKKRMTTVLMLMAREGFITPQEASDTALSILLGK